MNATNLTIDIILQAFEIFGDTLLISEKTQERVVMALNAANAGNPEHLRRLAGRWLAVFDGEISGEEFVARSHAWVRSNKFWPVPSDLIAMGYPDPRPIIEAGIRLSRAVTPGGYLGDNGKIITEKEQWRNLVRSKFGDPPPRYILDLLRAAGGYRGLKACPLSSEDSYRFARTVKRVEEAPRGYVPPEFPTLAITKKRDGFTHG